VAYFPAFIDLDAKKILLVGGGEVATRKLQTLLDFTRNITVVACEVDSAMQNLLELYQLPFYKRTYTQEDLVGCDMVVVTVDSLVVQKEIYAQTRKTRCLCNCVDLKECCDFTFGAYIKEEELVVAISTSGISPGVAKALKKQLKNALPQGLRAFLQELRVLRETLPKGVERMEILKKRVQDYFEAK